MQNIKYQLIQYQHNIINNIEQMKKNNGKKKERFNDVEMLQKRIEEQKPKTGQYFYDYKLQQAKKQQNMLTSEEYHRKYKINFADLPISQACIRGLSNRNFTKMTEIQRCVIPHALADRNVLAASRTGSGKTLCYLIPIVEKLYRHKFIPMDGLGALIIVPVRQLAIQVFEVLNSFTSNIQLSVGLIIGGKNVGFQKQRINNMNILVCTPGRLLQHLQQTYGFQANNLQMIVLDEADVMMEMGFQNTLKSIIDHLPKCQTLLFSATLTNQIPLLRNLSIEDAQKIFLHSKQNQPQKLNNNQSIYQTPAKLMQYYMMVQPHQKMNTLYSFLKTHQRDKIIVFVSTCKQVRFIYQSLKKFRLGLPMYQLQGHQKQKKRMAIYFTFCQKKYGLLVSTNIASRGLDFPMIDWVIQFDIPQNSQTYVHRVGRTARFKNEGKSLTFVSECEGQFLNDLKLKNINVHKIKQNPDRFLTIQSSLQSICGEHQDIKYLAQKAIISYLKFVHKASNKLIFNIKKINTAKLAQSYGLQNAPIIQHKSKQDDQNQQQHQEEQGRQRLTKIQKIRMKSKMKKNEVKQSKNKKIKEQALLGSETYIKQTQNQINQANQQDFLKIKSRLQFDKNSRPILSVSKNRLKKIRNQGIFDGKNKIHFDDDLNPMSDQQYLKRQYLLENNKNATYTRDLSANISKNKQEDEQNQKRRRKQRRIKMRDQIKSVKGEILPERANKQYGKKNRQQHIQQDNFSDS